MDKRGVETTAKDGNRPPDVRAGKVGSGISVLFPTGSRATWGRLRGRGGEIGGKKVGRDGCWLRVPTILGLFSRQNEWLARGRKGHLLGGGQVDEIIVVTTRGGGKRHKPLISESPIFHVGPHGKGDRHSNFNIMGNAHTDILSQHGLRRKRGGRVGGREIRYFEIL